jgi:hypothetical protein
MGIHQRHCGGNTQDAPLLHQCELAAVGPVLCPPEKVHDVGVPAARNRSYFLFGIRIDLAGPDRLAADNYRP